MAEAAGWPASTTLPPVPEVTLVTQLLQLHQPHEDYQHPNLVSLSLWKTEVVVFGGGHQQCQWHVAGHRLKRTEPFIHLGMLFYEDRHIKHAVQHRLARGYAQQVSIFSRYIGLGCANSVQRLLRSQQAIQQPCASYVFYASEVWAPASACIGLEGWHGLKKM